MNLNSAQELYDLGFDAGQTLLKILQLESKMTAEEFAEIKKGVGVPFGQIDWHVLSIITKQYPELDKFKSDDDKVNCDC